MFAYTCLHCQLVALCYYFDICKLSNLPYVPFLKHVLASQNEFGRPKSTWYIDIISCDVNWKTHPPSIWENFPLFLFYFFRAFLWMVICVCVYANDGEVKAVCKVLSDICFVSWRSYRVGKKCLLGTTDQHWQSFKYL